MTDLKSRAAWFHAHAKLMEYLCIQHRAVGMTVWQLTTAPALALLLAEAFNTGDKDVVLEAFKKKEEMMPHGSLVTPESPDEVVLVSITLDNLYKLAEIYLEELTLAEQGWPTNNR